MFIVYDLIRILYDLVRWTLGNQWLFFLIRYLPDFKRQSFFKFRMFFILRTTHSCFQAVATNLQLATLKCRSNKEKNILYCLLRFIRAGEKVSGVSGAFSEALIIKTRLKNIFQRPKLSWIGKISHSTQLRLTKNRRQNRIKNIFINV